MDGIYNLIVSIGVNIIGYYVCKWLDRHLNGQ